MTDWEAEAKRLREENARLRAEIDRLRPPLDLLGMEPPDPVQEAFEMFAEVAADLGLEVPQRLTDQRRKAIKARLKECGGLTGWQFALTAIRASPFLQGRNEQRWRCDLDFILRQSKFTKLMEGGYGKPANGVRGPGGIADAIPGADRSELGGILAGSLFARNQGDLAPSVPGGRGNVPGGHRR